MIKEIILIALLLCLFGCATKEQRQLDADIKRVCDEKCENFFISFYNSKSDKTFRFESNARNIIVNYLLKNPDDKEVSDLKDVLDMSEYEVTWGFTTEKNDFFRKYKHSIFKEYIEYLAISKKNEGDFSLLPAFQAKYKASPFAKHARLLKIGLEKTETLRADFVRDYPTSSAAAFFMEIADFAPLEDILYSSYISDTEKLSAIDEYLSKYDEKAYFHAFVKENRDKITESASKYFINQTLKIRYDSEDHILFGHSEGGKRYFSVSSEKYPVDIKILGEQTLDFYHYQSGLRYNFAYQRNNALKDDFCVNLASGGYYLVIKPRPSSNLSKEDVVVNVKASINP